MQTGEFVRWKSEDDDGKFNYLGKVLASTEENVTMVTEENFVVSFPKDDGVVEMCKKPAGWSIKTPKIITPIMAVKKATIVGSKADMVAKLLAEHDPSSRKEAIELIVAAGISTKAGASTHYNNARKK